jgi:hypothetical protein
MAVEITSWLVEIAQHLHNNTVGVYGNTPTANIFTQQLPDSPVLAIGVFIAGGPGGPDGENPLTQLNLQVLVRRTKNIDGLRYAEMVFRLLDNTWNITPSYACRVVGDHMPGPNYLASSGYPVYTLNFSATLTD